MSKIIIEAHASWIATDATLALLKGGFVANTARISYNINHGLPFSEDIDKYPLILEGTLARMPITIHVFSVTAGYGGTGPQAMVEILKAAGFQFDEDDILTNRCANSSSQISLTYHKR